MKKKTTKRDKVNTYISKHPNATATQVAKATGVSYNYCWSVMKTPNKKVRKEVVSNKTPRFRSEVLFTAEQLVSKDREKEHGNASDNWSAISGLWSSYLGYHIPVESVPIMLLLIKVARLRQNKTNTDNYVDICGYSALAAEQVR